MVIEPLCWPSAGGVKTTEIEQLAEAANTVPHFDFCVNGPLTVIDERVIGRLDVFVNVIALGAEDVLTS